MFRFIPIFAFILFAISTIPAEARNDCDSMWFARNHVFDRAGYCFKSNLGKSTFGTQNCGGNARELTSDEKAKVALVREFEEEWSCSVDTSKTVLDLVDGAYVGSMRTIPTPYGNGFSCFGWSGPEVTLYDGVQADRAILGSILTGDVIEWPASQENGWDYVRVYDAEMRKVIAAGWAIIDSSAIETQCERTAG